MPRASIIYNPIAGGGRGEDVSRQAEDRLRERGWDVERTATKDRRGATPAATALAERAEGGRPPDRVVVVGGDGTLRETIDGLGRWSARLPVAVVPMGNANVVAHELGLGDVQAAIARIDASEVVSMDVGTVTTDRGSEIFLAVVGVGWDADTVRLLDRARYGRAGRVAYRLWADGLYGVAGLAAALRPGQPRFSATLDGTQVGDRYCAAWICNLRTYGKGMSVAPDAHRASGLLHTRLRRRASLPFLLAQLGYAVAEAPAPAWVSDGATATSVRIEGRRPVAVQVDGDDRGWTRVLEVGIRPGAARMVAAEVAR